MPRLARVATVALTLGALLSATADASAAPRSTAVFSVSPLRPVAGTTLTVDGSRSKCAARPCTFAWTGGYAGARAQTLGAKPRLALSVARAGSFKLTLTVTDKRRRKASTTRTIVIATRALSPSITPPLVAAPPIVQPSSAPEPGPVPDRDAPAPPTFTAPEPDALRNAATLTLAGTAEPFAVVAVQDGTAPAGTLVAGADGTWALALTGLSDGVHTFSARAGDAAGNVSAASAPRVVRVDTTAPDTPVLAAPGELLNRATFTLAGTAEPGAAVSARDGATPVGSALADGQGRWQLTLSGVTDGTHGFSAQARDAAGNASAFSPARVVRVDTIAPVPVLDRGPDTIGADRSPVFEFSAPEAGVSFRCRLDGPGGSAGTEAPCTSPLKLPALADGAYTLHVSATDAAGNAAAAPLTRAFAIDTSAPDAPIITAPGALLNRSTVTLTGTGEAGARVEVLEGEAVRGSATVVAGVWTVELAGVADGEHRYSARAKDLAGNVSAGSAEVVTRVDTAAPAPPELRAPIADGLFAQRDVEAIGTAEAGSIVRLQDGDTGRGSVIVDDDGEWAIHVAELPDGRHALTATATDAAGNRSAPSPARAFEVDTTAPETQIDSGPTGEISESTATFTFSSPEPGVTFECRLGAAAAFEACASPRTLTGLVDGEYEFAVRATDRARHVDPEPAVARFAVAIAGPGHDRIHLAPEGDDTAPCTRSAPCASLTRAYAQASDGAVIELAAGRYGDQVLPKGEKAVTVRRANGDGQAEIRYLDARSDGINVTGLKLEKLNVRGSRQVYDDVVIDAKFARHVGLEHWEGDDNVFKNGSVGNVTNEKGALIGPKRFTFHNVVFHDVRNTDPLVHNECLYASGAEGLTITASTFHECATMDLFVTNYVGGPEFGNITLENNVFEHSTTDEPGGWHHFSVGVHGVIGALRNWVVRNNTFEIAMGGTVGMAGSGRWSGNLGAWDCVPGISYQYNVGQSCGELDSGVYPAVSTKDRPAPFGWISPRTFDFRLGPLSPAVDAADPTDAPATDRDGRPRTLGFGPDAGAYESH